MVRKILFSVSIKDCRVEEIASTQGAGGQRKNRRHTAIRVTHEPSGAVGFSADEAHQWKNKQAAFRRMAESKEFQIWNKLTAAKLITGKSVDDLVDEAMEPKNVKTEMKADGKWVPWGDSSLE